MHHGTSAKGSLPPAHRQPAFGHPVLGVGMDVGWHIQSTVNSRCWSLIFVLVLVYSGKNTLICMLKVEGLPNRCKALGLTSETKP